MKKILSIILCFLFSFQSAEAESNDRVNFWSGFGETGFNLQAIFFYPYDPTKSKLSFRIKFEGSLKNGELNEILLDEDNFHIPADLSADAKPGRFHLRKSNIDNGSFRKLYNYLSDENRIRLELACSYLSNEDVINEIINFSSRFHPSRKDFLIENDISEDALYLAKLCEENSKKVYVKDVQHTLKALGYNPGPVDGKWGNKTRTALKALFQENGLEWKQKLTSSVFRELREPLGKEGEKLIGEGANSQYFDHQGNLKNVPVRNVPVNLNQKLKDRKTINVCRPWNSDKGLKKYGIAWTADPRFSNQTITLNEVYWNYHYVGKSWSYYKGIEKFLTGRNWSHDAEYGKTLATRIVDPNFQTFIAKVIGAKVKGSKSDGVMLDWWHNQHESSSGYSKNQVSNARKNIAKAIRKEIGPLGIILGNVSWRKDRDTAGLINGVFLELYKEPYYSSSNRLHNSSELNNIQDILEFYDKNLKSPKLICLEGWRKTKAVTDKDRNTPENRKMAKLLTAMSVVIPKNGYILYADNNPDTPDGDHDHLYYDFYSFDIGKPKSDYIKVSWGVGYKEHDTGFIAYNINSGAKSIKRANGQSFNIPGKSGLFCEDKNKKTKCLPID